MAFGKAPCIPAHEGGNPILPRPDRAIEGGRSRNPSVPRAPRAKARANSRGYLSRELKKDSNHSSLSSIGSARISESRRPAAESPFSHARVNLLNRERTAVENQVFEMGPKVIVSLDRGGDFQRGHTLAKENAINQGMPWSQPKEHDDSLLVKARRSTLHHERLAADQALEWVPKEAEATRVRMGDKDSEIRSHARVNIYAREVGGAAQTLEMAPMVQVCGFQSEAAAAVGGQYHGRRNIIARETAEESGDAPIARGFADEGVPSYARKTMLPAYVPRAPLAAH